MASRVLMALAGTGTFRPEKAKMSGKVLVLDDDVDAVEMLDAALTSRGFRVTCETRALAALTRAADGEFDAVVTDLQLDELDGLEVCARLLSAQPDLPVIVVTGFASLETAVAALRAGAHDFVTKPIDLDLLGLTVERAVQQPLASIDAPEHALYRVERTRLLAAVMAWMSPVKCRLKVSIGMTCE